MLHWFQKNDPPAVPVRAGWRAKWAEGGITLTSVADKAQLTDPMLPGFLAQMVDDGLAVEVQPGAVRILWDALYAALAQSGYTGLSQALHLPPITQAKVTLHSQGSLTDPHFSIGLGWRDGAGAVMDCSTVGPVLRRQDQLELMQPAQWPLWTAVIRFARRDGADRHEAFHRKSWSRLRECALAAQAEMDHFLAHTVVLTPEKLRIGLRKSAHVQDDSVIEIEPGFDGAPADWLARFDGLHSVPDRYDLPTTEGIVQVLISPAVKTVLQEVKRLPQRRVAGSRAQAFILNPYAVLGEGAKDVIVEEQFERAREDAGLHYECFVPQIEQDDHGQIVRTGLLIERADASGPVASETRWFRDPAELNDFVGKLDRALSNAQPLLGWQGHDFELRGESSRHLAALHAAQAGGIAVTYAEVHDLSRYAQRVDGIGVEPPYYSPYIAKKSEQGDWFPDNVDLLISYPSTDGGEPVKLRVSRDDLRHLDEAMQLAEQHGQSTVTLPWLPKPMAVAEARTLVEAFDAARKSVEQGRNPAISASPTPSASPSKTLILRTNIHAVDYAEQRKALLSQSQPEPRLPSRLQPAAKLLPHQREGLAWLQQRHAARESSEVRGALLADDMGLGKTFQLLAFMAEWLEQQPATEPMLVVAPVSLLENWQEEIQKFFLPATLPLLIAYGSALNALRVPVHQIDERLRQDGLVGFLKPGWIGSAKLVLTTYETLRDLEFSFAEQRWSIMVCDEAQRIKNPAAMVTRAAKKQNVGFRIACTGTPVENTLADLWCLFDFIQPGLLGALNDFGRRYRKPIEAKTEEERLRVQELRVLIEPQILRRTKAEVAKNLPRKIMVEACRTLPLSQHQRRLYSHAIDLFKKRRDPASASPFKNHLGLLHYLRLMCTDPQHPREAVFKSEPLAEYRRKAPKMDWLLNELEKIRRRGEKVIVFCEFREIQRWLQHAIQEALQFNADIINGDTSASAYRHDSRQKRLKTFQSRPGFGVIILSPVAVGFGVNIQAANHVVHYTRTWNPAKEDQATDRAYRIGQTKDVFVYCPVVCAPDFTTFDAKLDELLSHKRSLADDMLNGAGDLGADDFNLLDVVPLGESKGLDERIDLDRALRMDGRYFEGLITALWAKQGYSDHCYCTPSSRDQGVDVVAISGNQGVLIQAKTSSSPGKRLGWEAVKDVVAGSSFYERQYPNVRFQKVIVTNHFFNDHAKERANDHGVQVYEQSQLEALLKKYPVTRQDVDRALFR